MSLALYKAFFNNRLSMQLQANNLLETDDADALIYSGIRTMSELYNPVPTGNSHLAATNSRPQRTSIKEQEPDKAKRTVYKRRTWLLPESNNIIGVTDIRQRK